MFGSFSAVTGVLSVATKVPQAALKLVQRIGDKLSDGDITPDEAEALAREASAELGDLIKVKIKGVDLVDDDAQADLAAFLGRVARNAVTAAAA